MDWELTTMSDCGCAQTRKLLEEYVHEELDSERSADIREHIAHCPECQREHQVSVVLTEVIARSCREKAPEELKTMVISRIREIQAGHSLTDQVL